MLKIYLKCNNCNRAFSDWFPLSYQVSKEKGVLRKFLNFWSSRTAFLAFSQANSQTNWIWIDCILQKWLSFHKNNDFITQIVRTWKCQNFNLNFTWFLPEFHSWGRNYTFRQLCFKRLLMILNEKVEEKNMQVRRILYMWIQHLIN
jgi:hypothetical protein